MRAVALFARGLASANWCTVLTQGHRGYCATVALYCCFQSPVPAAAATGEHWQGRAGPRHQAALLLTSQWVWCWVEVSLVTTGGAVWSAEARVAVCSVQCVQEAASRHRRQCCRGRSVRGGAGRCGARGAQPGHWRHNSEAGQCRGRGRCRDQPPPARTQQHNAQRPRSAASTVLAGPHLPGLPPSSQLTQCSHQNYTLVTSCSFTILEGIYFNPMKNMY